MLKQENERLKKLTAAQEERIKDQEERIQALKSSPQKSARSITSQEIGFMNNSLKQENQRLRSSIENYQKSHQKQIDEVEARARRKVEDMDKKMKYQIEKNDVKNNKALRDLRQQLEKEKEEEMK